MLLISCNAVEENVEKIKEKFQDKETPTPTATATIRPTRTPTIRPTTIPIVPTISPTVNNNPAPGTTKTPSSQPTSATTVAPTVSANPIASGLENFKDGNYGNLWKPVSDTTGNLVVVFHNRYKKKFSEGCFIDRKDGGREELFCNEIYKCFGNPDRLTMRSTIKCNQAKEVKVVCYEANQTVTFTVDEALRGQVCRRHD